MIITLQIRVCRSRITNDIAYKKSLITNSDPKISQGDGSSGHIYEYVAMEDSVVSGIRQQELEQTRTDATSGNDDVVDCIRPSNRLQKTEQTTAEISNAHSGNEENINCRSAIFSSREKILTQDEAQENSSPENNIQIVYAIGMETMNCSSNIAYVGSICRTLVFENS